MKNKKLVFLLIFIVIFQLVVFPAAYADETGYYRTLEDSAYKMKNSYTVKNLGSSDVFYVRAKVLVGALSDSPYQQNISYNIDPMPKYTYVDSSGNVFAEIYIDRIKAKETKVITVEKQLINGGITYEKNIYNMGADYTEFNSHINNKQYTEPGEKVESTAPEIIKQASNFDLNQTKVQMAKQIYDFVNLFIDYDNGEAYANKGALSGLKTGKGVCEEYAALFVALARALNLPARMVTGYWINDEAPLEPDKWNDVSDEAHAWAEFYLPQVGWIPVEPTFLYTYNGVRMPHLEHFANILPGDIHLINGYQQNEIKKDINVSYSSYGKASMEIGFQEQSVMPVKAFIDTDAFSDISSSWARDYINKLYNEGVLFPKQQNLYKPADKITRAEFSAYLVNALQLDHKAPDLSFKDVNDSAEYAYFINTAAAYGLIKGSQGYFRPNDTITRQDTAVIMQRAIELLKINCPALIEPEFSDMNKISSYATDSVKTIYSMKIMNGKPGNIFDPKNFTTRAEASKLLDNFINAIE